ncbi:MAG: F0F1 ATP synthase subunit B' [Pseudomonadota bacterium]
MADEPTTAAETTSACVDIAGGAVGMPQLCTDWFGNQIFWLVITLVIIYLVLAKIALPRIAAVLAERQGTITNDLAAAEDLKAKAVEAEEAYHKALADARAEAQTIIAATKADIKVELDKATAKADAEIAARAAEGEAAISEIRANAMESVKEVAQSVASDLVGAMWSKSDEKAIANAVTARMKG